MSGARDNEKVKLTPELESATIDEVLLSAKILREQGKLGALLLQLSPAFSPKKHNLSELDQLISKLSAYSLAIEFRNRHWVSGDHAGPTFAFLRRRALTLVLVDAPHEKHFTILPSELNETTNPRLNYLRLHGRSAEAYLKGKTVAARFDYDYSDQEIDEVVERARKLARSAGDVHVVFNNNNLDYAPRAALRLRASLGQIAVAPARQAELFPKR